jgi:hypothetical protein
VNYLLPEINRRLARDADNRLIGYDFWDMDDRPYDAHPVNSGFFVQRHGTRTASILLREAADVELVPYRYPRPDMSRMQALIEHAASNGVEILGMPLGSNRLEDWSVFERSARAHPRMLFVVSAGNNGRDIDEHPVYPASLDLDNLLVVTSSDDFLRPAERTNWGRISVDYMVPAEGLPALDYSGKSTMVSGSSYAVSRITALAARLKLARPDWHAAEIVAELRRRYAGDSEAARKWVGGGYIADPLAGAPITMTPLTGIEIPVGDSDADALLSLQVLAGEISVRRVDSADYLRDLSTGGARTLLGAAKTDNATIVFARDTRMQAQFTGEAFGIANTRMRPWLTNSVWLMLDVDDPGIALAHELYHVLANSGDHVEGGANLMQGRTRPDSTKLTSPQCRLALETGAENRLLE